MHPSEFEHSESSATEIARQCTKKILDAVASAAETDPSHQRIMNIIKDAEIHSGLMQMAEQVHPQKKQSLIYTLLHRRTLEGSSLQTELTDLGYVSVFSQSRMLLPETPTESWLFDAVHKEVIESDGHELSAERRAEFVNKFMETSYVTAVQLEVQFSHTEKLRLCFVSNLDQWSKNTVLMPDSSQQNHELYEVSDEASAAFVKAAILQQIADHTRSQRLWLTQAR